MKHRKTVWRLCAKALGEKASKCDRESDTIALIRMFIFATYLITNTFIIAGVVRHWNDQQHQVSGSVSQTKEKILFKAGGYVL
jgi:hypothetical protein